MRKTRTLQLVAPLVLAAIMLSPIAFAARNVIPVTTAPGRYPTAVGRVGGADTVAAQGLVAPTF